MNDQTQGPHIGPQVQVDVGDQLFHCIVEILARLEAQHERMSERIDSLSGDLQELVKRQSALGSHQTIISIPSVVQDAIAPCSEGQIEVLNERDETQSISATHADNLKRKHVRQDSHFGFDGEDQREIHRLIAISKAQDPLPRSTYIEDDIDTRACKLVDQVIFGKKLLNPSTNVDPRSWLVTMAEDLFDKKTPLRRIRLCLHFFAAMLEPQTLINLKTTDEQLQAEEEAKTKAMLFCIQLHVGYCELENPSSQPKLAYGVPSEYVIFTEKHLNSQKAKRAAWKNKELRQAIETGSKLEALRLHMGPGTIHLIPTKIWLEM
ncbi:uncharacterized protein K489DRAFT_71481 [Dissoconium aciculare CBS 342.82]|uniref:Uncharacterized protein n=1 Tax=Dissoconium aciculare CBS 342.82 TaxID=1314786 RepID=A0A6J3LYD8_9PEZI|nr:uncharacterized protein K489DRAFT_71481 [Dissoconium aciculare CBS 342.82]KAF1819637.1 hypothetical protein K489DRAFT_71481 [Dissoconium aciculare CBS 342.82]